MKKDDKNPPTERIQPVEGDETQDQDFQYVLKELLSAYQPILEEQLRLAQSPDLLEKEDAAHPPSCDDEFELANRIFEKFTSEEVTLRLLPREAREQLGPVDQWRWCFLHIRCCFIFGWLACCPRGFRRFSYYLYRYWLCVRQVLGIPVRTPPTDVDREDFQTLVRELAVAYRPFLTDQLASVDFPTGIPDEVIGGKIDCLEGEEEATAIFERFLASDIAPALLGRETFESRIKDPSFWFCRCWCLCAIRFGCCLARARNFVDVRRCLKMYQRCLRDCFRPLVCELTDPSGCAEEREGLVPGAVVALEIKGTAGGAFFQHYVLQWRKVQGQACDDNTAFSSAGIIYPGGGATGTIPVFGGTLGWLDTTVLAPDSYEIRLLVFTSVAQQPQCRLCRQFALFKKMVWIDRVADLPGAPVRTPPGWFDHPAGAQEPIVSFNVGGIIVPVGACFSVVGTAVVGDCQERRIACVDLRAAIGWQPGTAELTFPGTVPLYTINMLVAPICYPDPDPVVEGKKRAPWNQLYERPLTSRWVTTTILGSQYPCLQRFCFNSAGLLPPCPDANHPCRSGQYTLLLDVTDTLGNHYYDTQQIWVDNKPIHVEFDGLEGVKACEDVCLSRFVPKGAPCNICWPMSLLGVAYDEYIVPADTTYPSDNFDFYSLYVTRQGGPTYNIPITPDCVFFGPDPHKGTQRIGEPGTRCEEAIVGCPAPVHAPRFPGALTQLDLRVFDAVCAGSAKFPPPAGFPLERGTCCGYTFQLYGQDKTWSDGVTGGLHHAWSLPWAVEVCNDLNSDANIPQCRQQ